MYVETWSHFGTVLTNIRPALSPADKRTCNQVIAWGIKQGNNYFGINEQEKSEVNIWIGSIRNQFSGTSNEDLARCMGFTARLNDVLPAVYFHTLEGCRAHGHYFYGDACHAEPLQPTPRPPTPPTPPEPEPEPEIEPTPKDIIPPPPIPEGLEELLSQVEEYYKSLTITEPIKKGIALIVRNWLRTIVGFQTWLKGRK